MHVQKVLKGKTGLKKDVMLSSKVTLHSVTVLSILVPTLRTVSKKHVCVNLEVTVLASVLLLQHMPRNVTGMEYQYIGERMGFADLIVATPVDMPMDTTLTTTYPKHVTERTLHVIKNKGVVEVPL